jgi:hypothetical protein
MGGLDCSVFLLSLSLLIIVVVVVVVVLIGGMRGTFIVAVTEFDPSRSSPFSSREVSWLIELVVDRGGGEIVKVAEIFCSSLSS